MRTTYEDLLGSFPGTDLEEWYPEPGAYVSKRIGRQRYWYFQTRCEGERVQRYAGTSCNAVLNRVRAHRSRRVDERQRHRLVSTLVRSLQAPAPTRELGALLRVLAREGVFTRHAVVIGTIALQTYGPLLGVRLPAVPPRFSAMGIVRAEGSAKAPAEVLQHVKAPFRVLTRPVGAGLWFDLLTANARLREADLWRLATLRDVGFLVEAPERVVVLAQSGVAVWVPTPERFALHQQRVARVPAALLDVLRELRPLQLQRIQP